MCKSASAHERGLTISIDVIANELATTDDPAARQHGV